MTNNDQTQTPAGVLDRSARPAHVPESGRGRQRWRVPSAVVTVAIGLVAMLILPSCAGESTVGSDGVSTTVGPSINAAGLNWVRVPIHEEGWLIPESLTATPSGFVLFARPTAEYSWPPEPSGPLRRWESINGREWTLIGTNAEVFRPGERMGPVVGNNWGVIGMGFAYPPVEDDQGDLEFVIWTSQDGRSWQRTDGLVDQTLAVGAAGYLVGQWRGDHSGLLYSPDGTAWDPVDLPENLQVMAGAGFAGGLVAWGREFDMEAWPWLLLTSPNGREWSTQSMDEALGQHGEATFSAWRNEVLLLANLEINEVFAGDMGMWRSADAIEWVEMQTAPVVNPDGSWPDSISSGDAGIFLTGATQEPQQPPKTTVVWFSPNGEVWHRAETADLFGSGWSIARAAVGNDTVLVAIMADEEPSGEAQSDSFTLPPVEIWIGTPAS